MTIESTIHELQTFAADQNRPISSRGGSAGARRPPGLNTKADSPGDSIQTAAVVNRVGSWWSRHSAIVNFWLDVLLLILFLVQGWMLSVIVFVFPRGAGPDWKIWGATALDWTESFGTVFGVFSVGILVHVMFHWAWICGVVSTRLLKRKARKDDGSHTLIGVGLIVAIVHLLIGGILVAKMFLVGPQ